MQTAPLRPLGKTGAEVPAIGAGTNRWSYGANDAPVFETYQALVDAGGAFIDTAEIYGLGKSERLIGDCLRRDGRPAFVASKFAPFVARTSPRHLMAALDASLARLGIPSIDLYYVHFPFPFADLGGFADGLAEAVKSGKIGQSLIDQACSRILRTKFLLGLFENPFVREELSLVVAGAAGVKVAAFHCWSERRSAPFAQRFPGKNIVVAVND